MNREELRTILDQKGVSSALTSNVLTVVEKKATYALEFVAERKRWLVCGYIGGDREVIGGFHSEAGACEKLYYALTNTNKDFIRLLENLPFEKTRGLKDPLVVRDLKGWLFENAGAAEPRLISSLLQLIVLLLAKRIPLRAYSILGCNLLLDPNGGRSLEYDLESDSWSVWIYDRGEKGCIYDADSKTEAFTIFYHLLVDSPHKASRTILAETPTMTCETLKDLLMEKGIPRDWYSILGDAPPADDMLMLEHNSREKTWDLFHFERGLKSLVNTFYSESAACEELLCLLLYCQEESARSRGG